MPKTINDRLNHIAEIAILKSLDVAIKSIKPASKRPPATKLSSLLAGISGGVGAFSAPRRFRSNFLDDDSYVARHRRHRPSSRRKSVNDRGTSCLRRGVRARRSWIERENEPRLLRITGAVEQIHERRFYFPDPTRSCNRVHSLSAVSFLKLLRDLAPSSPREQRRRDSGYRRARRCDGQSHFYESLPENRPWALHGSAARTSLRNRGRAMALYASREATVEVRCANW